MICPKCGAFVQNGSRFCNHCGEKLNKEPTVEDIPTIMTRPRDEKFDLHSNDDQEEPEDTYQPPKQKWWVILCIILSGALLALVAIIVFNAMQQNQRIVITPSQTASQTAVVEKTEEPSAESSIEETENNESTSMAATETDSAAETVTEAPYEDLEYEGVLYRVYDSYAVLLKSYSENRILTIPSEVYGKPVTIIANEAFSESSKVQYVTLPEGLQIILFKSFANCSALKEVYIPESVTSIQNDTFENTAVTIISHSEAYAKSYADHMNISWIEGDGTSEQY